ncbi:MAG TPA: methyltransferase [Candidatus Limnocylindrales bacterium]|nr:methyltransferase [Candidatus Limnocylindrales bacterium]
MRALLERAGYDTGGIRSAGIDVGLGVRRPDVPVLLRLLGPDEPLSSLVRLFLFGQSLDTRELRRRLGPDLEVLGDAGLVRTSGARTEPTAQLTPWRDFIVAHDVDPAGPLWPEHVSGPTPAAETLARLIIPGDAETSLDLGTGSGILALALATLSHEVVATDVNPAALRYARLSAGLSGLENIDVREGSLFEPVAGARFDRVVSNPPFVIGPDSAFVFRHSELPDDQLSRRVAEGAAEHLADGGFAAILGNWIVPRGERWLDPVRSWLEGTGCDAVVMLHGVEDPLSYAVRWNGRSQYVEPDAFRRLLGRWLEYDRTREIEAIASGGIALRRSGTSSWVHGLQLDGEPRGEGPAHLARLFAAGDRIAAGIEDERLLDTSVALDAPHRLEQSLVSRPDGYTVEPAQLTLDDSLGVSMTIPPDLIPFVLQLDGSRTVRETLTAVDHAGASAPALQLVRGLLERGYVSLAEAGA